jgi:ribosome-associated protein
MELASSRMISADDIPDSEIREEFLCTASGPGGQNVNRTANTVRLIFHAAGSSLLDEESRMRLYKAHTPDPDGNLVILCRESRSLQQNRIRAREILAGWLTLSLKKPRRRKKTKPTFASREKRLKTKSLRSQTKSLRGRVNPE